MSCCISTCIIDDEGTNFTAITDIEAGTTTYINLNTGVAGTPVAPVIACDALAALGALSTFEGEDLGGGVLGPGNPARITHTDGAGDTTIIDLESQHVNSVTAGEDTVNVLGIGVSPYRTLMSCDDGVMQIVTTNLVTGGTQTQRAHPILVTAQETDGSVASFFGDDSVNDSRAYTTMSNKVIPGNAGCTHSVIFNGFYEVRPEIVSSAPASMSTQMQVSPDGGSTWFAGSGNTYHYGEVSSGQASEESIPFSTRLNLPAGTYDFEFRVVLLSKSGVDAGDELALTQSRRTAAWTEMCCVVTEDGDF